ncbi:hypothetical protein NBRC3293_1152 [Gluconobacter oxydans NBRC 3293]|uniref:Uncharacterized protein n=1 Tax=Gluconobacter oxydans NBRC 3293 TaxID=1315969 RepID=A0A829WN88_GLUOY|nr:hypothetical protein NBRC3293_1152 [Gluconobacter oxydans NBRC 3293]
MIKSFYVIKYFPRILFSSAHPHHPGDSFSPPASQKKTLTGFIPF